MDDDDTNSPNEIPELTKAEEAASEPEPLAAETVLIWLARIKSADALALLREPEFAPVSAAAFAGFRVNSAGYSNPIVRKRLAREAVRASKFADKLRDLAEQSPAQESTTPSAPVSSPPLPDPLQAIEHVKTQAAAQVTALRAERDQRRRERDEARLAAAEAVSSRTDLERRLHRAEVERDEAVEHTQRQSQRLSRLERQVAHLQFEQTSLLRAMRRQEADSKPRETPQDTATLPAPSQASDDALWRTAVLHLLDKRRYDAALSIAEDILRASPDNIDALTIAAQIQEARGETRTAALLLRRMLAGMVAQAQLSSASDAFLRFVLLVPPGDAEREMRTLLAGLSPSDSSQTLVVQTMLGRLRGIAPEKHAALAAQISRAAPAALVDVLLPPPGRIGPDDPLPLPALPPTSARQVLAAVDRGDEVRIEQIRLALAQVCQTDADTGARVRQILEQTAGEDLSALVPIFGSRKSRGAVIVDGSNAAWHGQESLAASRPRLRPLLQIRRALRQRGYFPVYLFGDAPLPYTIDEPDTLRAMVRSGQITLVDAGVDADEVLLREAKRLGAPIVSNDYMADWDPMNEVTKIRYVVPLSGEAYLESE